MLELGPLAAWGVRELVGYLVRRAGTKRALRAVDIARSVYQTSKDLGWQPEDALKSLRGGIHALGDELGLKPERLDRLMEEAERELGRLLLLDAFDRLGRAVDDFKMPDTSRLRRGDEP